MRQIIFALALLWSIATKGQATLQYRLCDNCPTGENTSNIDTTYIYPVMTPYTSAGVTSDFGARYRKPNYDWHKGVDFKPHGCAPGDGCRGTAVVTLGAGTVEAIYALHGMKMIAIAGTNGNHYGYGHIFNSRFIGANSNHTFINEGKFLIKNLDEFPNQKVYAIVDLTTYQAFGPTEGTVTIDVGNNPQSIYVRPIINENQDIAPMGGSGNSFYNGTGSENDPLPVHLHLYQFRDINKVRLVEETHETNCMNPLQSVTHQSPAIQVKWQTKGQNNNWNSPIINPNGTLPTRFRVRPLMLNVTDPSGGNVPETGSSVIYGNVVSNINKVEIEIKKSTENNFFRYSGKDYSGFINLGGTIQTLMYPIELTTDKRYGKWNRQGIEAFAYASSGGHPYDDYYFEGFYSRIKKSLGTGRLTDLPNAAKYTDDEYELRAKTTNVSGIESFSNIHTFKLDNFKPYIESYDIKLCTHPIHVLRRVGFQGKDKVVNDGYVMNTKSNTPFPSNTFCFPKFIEFTVNTSELMKDLQFKHKEFSSSQFSSSDLMTQDESNKLIWRGSFSIPAGLLSPFKYSIELSGTDMADNQILNVYSNTASNSISSKFLIPTRLSATTWSNLSINEGTDQIDFWIIDCGDRLLTGQTGNRNTEEICQILSEVESLIEYNSCKDATIRLPGLEFNQSNYTITWSDVSGNILTEYNDQNEISVVSAGTYCYKVEAIDDCCSTEGCVEVFQSEMQDKLEISETLTYSTCGESATIFITDVGELGNLYSNIKYLWNTGSTLKSINVPAGTYTVTLTVNNPTMYEYGCTNTKEFTVEERALTISATTEPICPDETGSIFPYITGGTEPYIFQWSNGETTQDIFDLPLGTYYLLVEDANGCWETAEFEIKIRDEIVEVSHFANLQDCSIPDGSISISSLLDEIITYRWYNSSGNQISTNKDLSGLSSGTYRLVATSENGCTTEITQSICCCNPGLNTGDPGACYIGYNKDLTVTGTVTHTSNGINNGSVILFVQGGKGQYVFNWTGPDGYSSSEKDISNLSQGEYTVTITDGCKVIIKNFIINDSLICQNTNINITDKTTCILQGVAPGKIDITVSGGKPPYSYQWTTDGSTAQDYSSYYGGSSIIVTDQNGCIAKKYYNLPNGNKLLANFLITNPDPCNEYVNDVLATIKIISGNPPYNVRISNNVGFNKVFTFNEEDFSVRVPAYNDGLLWNYVIYYFDVSDGCNFSVNESQTITCDKLCPERCLQVSVTNTGPGGCIDVEENIGLSGASRFKYESFCNDGMKREIYNETKNEGFVFETKASHEGQDLYKFNLAIYDIFLRNYTTGCVIHERIDASDRCWNLWNWFGTLAGGPSSNTSSSNPCPKYKNVVTPKYLPQKSNFHVDVSAEKDQEIEFEVSFNGKYLFSFYQNIGTSNTSIDFDFINQLPGDYIIKVHSPFADCKKEFKFKIENLARPAPINCNNDIINLVFDTTSNYFLSFERSDLSENNKLITNLLSKKLEYNSVIDSTLVINNIKNIEGIYMDKNYNLYNLVHEQIGDFLFEKMDINNNIIWTLPIKFNVYNVSRDSFGNFILIGFDSFNNKWITQSISTDGSLSSQVVVPLYTDQYSNIYHFDNSTIAFDSISNKLIFLTLSNFNEKVLPSGLNIKDIKNLENGNILIGAEFKGEMSIGELTYNSSGHNNAIFITYDNAGNILASQSVQNYRDETVEGIATKGNEEVAYHGRYTEIVNYPSDPSENVVESCIFVNIVTLNDSPCTILPPVLSLDVQTCTLDIEQQQMEVNYILQQKTDSTWNEISGATFPYTPEMNGIYRISASTPNCPSTVSEVVDVTCIEVCHKEALDIIYNDQQEKFQHFYKVGLQTNTVNEEWISPSTFESVQSLLALQCENITISYIRVDADQNIYIIGYDPGNIHRTRIIKYHHSTLEVLWSHWIENFRIESVIPYAVGNIITLAGYHPVEKTWYLKGYLLKDGVLSFSNVQNIDKSPYKINVEYDAIYWLGENKYIYKEHNNPSVTYKSPENTWTAPLSPLIVVREFSINHWNQVTVGGEFFGSFIINDVLYESGLFRSLIFITYNNTGQIIHVNVIKSDRHYILKTFANNGYYRYAYTGYVSETAFPDSLLQNTAAIPTLPGVCVATGGFVNENIQSRHISASFKTIRFYPNPFSKGINLYITSDKEEAVTIETFNTVGTLIFTTKLDIQKGQNVRYIDAFERIPTGVYIVKMKSTALEHLTRVIRIE